MAVVRLAYKLNPGVNILDTAKGLSIFGRSLVRQKQVFTVMGGLLVDNGDDNDNQNPDNLKVKLSTAPNNYYTRNAVSRCFSAWKKMRKHELDRTGQKNIRGKYADFKILLDATPTGSYLNPIDAGSVLFSNGEWMYSDIRNEAGVEKSMMIVGPHASAYSAVQGWLESRSLPRANNPEMPDLNSDGTPDVEVDFIATLYQDTNESTLRLEDIAEDNNSPPYNRSQLITSASTYSATQPKNLQLQFIAHHDLNETHVSVPGFQALCGLIRVDVEGGSNPILIIDVETKGWSF